MTDRQAAEPAQSPGWEGDQDEVTVMRLRMGVGVIGLLLPVALPLGNWIVLTVKDRTGLDVWPGSMSGSYHTSTRNLFVGSLCALGVILIAYRFDRAGDIAGTLAGAFALGVAFFPTRPTGEASTGQEWLAALHLVFALLLLLAMAFFCLVWWVAKGLPWREEVVRRYQGAGVLILVFTAGAVVAALLHVGQWEPITLLYLCEWGAVWTFGYAWLNGALALAVDMGQLVRTQRVFEWISRVTLTTALLKWLGTRVDPLLRRWLGRWRTVSPEPATT